MSREHAETYLAFLIEESGYGSNAIGGFIIAGRKLAGYLIDKDVIERQPFDGLKGIPDPTLPDLMILSAEDTQAHLPKPSTAKGVIRTIDRSLVYSRLGALTSADFERVKQSLRDIMNL